MMQKLITELEKLDMAGGLGYKAHEVIPQAAAAIREQDATIAELRAKLAEAGIRQVGMTAEIAGLKSQGPFILDETNPHLIYCEDEFVYLDPSNLQGVCDKLNQIRAKLAACEEDKKLLYNAIKKHKDELYELYSQPTVPEHIPMAEVLNIELHGVLAALKEVK